MFIKEIQRILIPSDLSEFSFCAFEIGSSLAKHYNASVYFLYVEENENVNFPKEKILKKFHFVKKKYFSNSINTFSIIKKGIPYVEIINFAKNETMDLIVIATHGKRGFANIFMGNVAEKVIRYSNIPVLEVKKTPESFINEEDIIDELHL